MATLQRGGLAAIIFLTIVTKCYIYEISLYEHSLAIIGKTSRISSFYLFVLKNHRLTHYACVPKQHTKLVTHKHHNLNGICILFRGILFVSRTHKSATTYGLEYSTNQL